MSPLRATEASQPKRSVFIYLPNGVNTLDFQITQSGEGYEFTQSLKPLEKHRASITPISGLHHPNGLGHHHNCSSIWLTGAKVGVSERNSISVDQLMAQVTAPHTRFSSMEMSNQGGSLARNADGIQLPANSKPSVIFKELFEEPAGGVASQRRALLRKGSILDTNLEEAEALRAKIGRDDRDRLDQYLTAVRETEIRTKRADSWLDVPRPEIDPGTKSKVNRDVSQAQVGEYFRTLYDLIVLAFQTDTTRVATFSTGVEGQGLAIPEIGITQTRHALSHHNGNPKQLQLLTNSDTFNIGQFAYFLDRLSETLEGGLQLLDSTMALYGSGMAYGHSHGNANLPLILAGGAKLGLKHGRHLDFNQGDNFEGYDLANPAKHYGICFKPVNAEARVSNLLLTMAQKMDVETEKFADSLGTVAEIQA